MITKLFNVAFSRIHHVKLMLIFICVCKYPLLFSHNITVFFHGSNNQNRFKLAQIYNKKLKSLKHYHILC